MRGIASRSIGDGAADALTEPRRVRRARVVYALACVLALGGCVSFGKTGPSRFYVLSSLIDSGSTVPQAAPANLPIGVRRVVLSELLDRPQIVTQSGPNEVTIVETERWAEPLADGIGRVVAENLAVLVPSDRVYVMNAASAPVDLQVEVQVSRFGLAPDKKVLLSARWIVRKRTGVLADRVSSFSAPLPGTHQNDVEYGSVAEGMSVVLGELCREIAAFIRSHETE